MDCILEKMMEPGTFTKFTFTFTKGHQERPRLYIPEQCRCYGCMKLHWPGHQYECLFPAPASPHRVTVH